MPLLTAKQSAFISTNTLTCRTSTLRSYSLVGVLFVHSLNITVHRGAVCSITIFQSAIYMRWQRGQHKKRAIKVGRTKRLDQRKNTDDNQNTQLPLASTLPTISPSSRNVRDLAPLSREPMRSPLTIIIE